MQGIPTRQGTNPRPDQHVLIRCSLDDYRQNEPKRQFEIDHHTLITLKSTSKRYILELREILLSRSVEHEPTLTTIHAACSSNSYLLVCLFYTFLFSYT
jgi:hypothetical protein